MRAIYTGGTGSENLRWNKNRAQFKNRFLSLKYSIDIAFCLNQGRKKQSCGHDLFPRKCKCHFTYPMHFGMITAYGWDKEEAKNHPVLNKVVSQTLKEVN